MRRGAARRRGPGGGRTTAPDGQAPHEQPSITGAGPPVGYDRRVVFAAACVGMLLFGVVMTTVGAILPALVAHYGIGKAEAGTLFSVLSLGVLAGSLVFGPIADRYGYKLLLVVSASAVLFGLEGLAFAPTFGALRAAVALVGLGGGALNGATNALVSDISAGGRGAGLSLLGAFFGIGASGVPLALGFLLDAYPYGTLVAAMGGLVAAPVAFFCVARFPAPKHAHGFPLRRALRLLREPLLLLMGLILFLESGIETIAGGWTTTYVEEVLDVAPSDAVFFLSLFWAGMMVARLLLGVVLRRATVGQTLAWSLAVALAAVVAFIGAPGEALAAPAVFVLGVGLAAMYPLVLGMVGDCYPTLSGSAFSVVFVLALTGGSAMPYVAGLMGEAYGLRAAFGLLPAAIVPMFGLLWLSLRRLRTQEAAAGGPPDQA